jgi:hypothetical protein
VGGRGAGESPRQGRRSRSAGEGRRRDAVAVGIVNCHGFKSWQGAATPPVEEQKRRAEMTKAFNSWGGASLLAALALSVFLVGRGSARDEDEEVVKENKTKKAVVDVKPIIDMIGKGAKAADIEADGGLRDPYLRRVRRVIEACDRHAAVVILGCYYQRQDQILKDDDAVRAGVVNVAQWLKGCGFTRLCLKTGSEQYSEVPLDHGHVNHSKEIQGRLFEPAHDAAAFFQPPHATFDDVAAAVSVSVERFGSSGAISFVGFLRDHRLNSTIAQPVENPVRPIGLVRSQFVGSPARAPAGLGNFHGFHGFLEGLGLVNLAGRDLGVQRHAVAVADQMDLGSKTAPGTA